MFLRLLILLVFVAPSAFAPSVFAKNSAKVNAKKPNIIFILTDDISWDSLNFLGGNVHTPRLNEMAEQGLYLSDFNVTSTVCSPSRYSYLTGRYAGQSQGHSFMKLHPKGTQTQVENNVEIEPHRWNIAKILQQNGYKTGFVGKSHIVNHQWLKTLSKSKSKFEQYSKKADPKDPQVNAKMQRNHQKWVEAIKPYGFDYVDGIYGANLRELHNEALNVHNLDWSVNKVFEFLEESKDQPFYLYFSTTLHHGPTPKNNQFSLKADPRMTGEGFVEQGFSDLPSRQNVLMRNKKAGRKDNMAHALWLDDGVGAIIDKVKELKLEEDTLIIFASDHGSYRHGKTTLYDYGMRVPLIMRWPGTIKPGSKYDGLLANIDIVPTLLDITGVEKLPKYEVDGVSFREVIDGKNVKVRDTVYGEMGYGRAIKTKYWKYIAVRYPDRIQNKIDKGIKFAPYKEGAPLLDHPYLTRNKHLGHYASAKNPHYFEPDQLYDLSSDPQENTNIYATNPETVKSLKDKLSEWLNTFEGRPFGEFTK